MSLSFKACLYTTLKFQRKRSANWLSQTLQFKLTVLAQKAQFWWENYF